MWSTVGSTCRLHNLCSGTYVYNLGGIFVQGHIPIIQNACIPVLVVILLTTLSLYGVCILTYLSHMCTWTYWHLWLVYGIFTCMCSTVGSTCRLHNLCSGTYVCNMAGIFVQGHIWIIQNACIPVIEVKLLIALSLCGVYIYWHTCLICAHELIGICGFYMAFGGYVSVWHIDGNSMLHQPMPAPNASHDKKW